MSRNTTYQYDVGGRLQTVTQPDSDGTGPAVAAYQKVTRDALGNVRSQTDAMLDPQGNSTAFTYDAWSRRFTQTDPLGAVTATSYDVFGNVSSVTDPLNNITSYAYNKLNQLTTETKTTNRTYEYDAAGNLTKLIDRNGRQTDFTYDNRQRLATESWNAGNRSFTYSYDTADRLVDVQDSNPLAVDFQFAYDSRSQLQAERQSGTSYWLGQSIALDRDFDYAGNETKLEANIGGTLVGTSVSGGIWDFANNYVYDGMNRLTTAIQSRRAGTTDVNEVANKLVTTSYNADSQVTDVRRYADIAASPSSLKMQTRHGKIGGIVGGITRFTIQFL